MRPPDLTDCIAALCSTHQWQETHCQEQQEQNRSKHRTAASWIIRSWFPAVEANWRVR